MTIKSFEDLNLQELCFFPAVHGPPPGPHDRDRDLRLPLLGVLRGLRRGHHRLRRPARPAPRLPGGLLLPQSGGQHGGKEGTTAAVHGGAEKGEKRSFISDK